MISRSFFRPLCFLTICAIVNTQAYAHSGYASRGRGASLSSSAKPLSLDISELRRRQNQVCSPDYRTLDGSCTNDGSRRGDILWGSSGTPHFTYITESSSTVPTRQNGNSARMISNVISDQTDNMFNRRGITEFFVFFGEFLDHNIISTDFEGKEEEKEELKIPIPEGDHLFANFSDGYLPFRRSRRVRELGRGGSERAMNTISAAIDLSTVYSSDAKRLNFLRDTGCRMKISPGELLPLNEPELENEPSDSHSFFLAGDVRANDHPVLTSLHTIFLREHNQLCHDLVEVYPENSSEDIFQMARKINIAQFQKVVFEEFYPTITGQDLPRYRRYNPIVNAATSDIFSTAGYRIGHTLVGNAVQLRGPGMSPIPSLSFQEMFFRSAAMFKEKGMEAFVRGAIDQTAQEVDEKVSQSLRDFLFTNVPEFQHAVDLIALNIQRGRDHALPSFNGVRKILRLSPARRFSDITSSVSLQSRLSSVYDSPDDVDPWIGMMSEDHVPGSSMGPTVRELWEKEFLRFRDGDRFHYARPGLFSEEMKKKFPKITNIMREKGTMKRLILEHTDITASEIPGPIFRKGGRA